MNDGLPEEHDDPLKICCEDGYGLPVAVSEDEDEEDADFITQ